AWPDAVAGQMERHYSPGRTWESLARGLVGFFLLGDVLDVGAGDGAVAQLLAPRSKSYTLVDCNERLFVVAGQRLAGQPNVRLVQDDLTKLDLPAGSVDLVLLLNALVEIDDPVAVLARLADGLRLGGRLLVVSLDAHEHAELAAAY